jgi:hypothetical protein
MRHRLTVSYPDLPRIPEIPSHRVSNMSPEQVLNQARGALHAAELAVHQLEHGAPAIIQLALIRYVVIECRRSTFVLQKLASRVEGFAEWYEPRQQVMASDALMKYFAGLRTQIEKEGLPSTMAELVDVASGRSIADVACGEDRHGIWVSGAMRPGMPFDPGAIPDAQESLVLRNFRLPDPPTTHRGAHLNDFRFSTLATLVIRYLWDEVITPASEQYG